MKYLFFSLFLIIGCRQLNAQTALRIFENKIIGLSTDTTLAQKILVSKEHFKEIKKFRTLLSYAIKKEEELTKLKGDIEFGMNANLGEEKKVFQMNGGLNITRNNFPTEFRFKTNMFLQMEDEKISEGLSNFSASYDKLISDKNHKSIDNDISAESFAFINRISNNMMNVKFRYEMGGGIILAHWDKKLSKKNRKEQEKLKLSGFKFRAIDSAIKFCDSACTGVYPINSIVKSDSNKLDKALLRLRQANIKEHARFRFGVLFGAFVEVENIEKSDSLTINSITNDKELVSINSAHGKFRFEIRPTIQFTLFDVFTVSTKPYFKLPLWYEWKTDVGGEQKVDSRIDLYNSIRIKVSEKVALGVDHNYFYDNAPNQEIITDAVGEPQYLSANSNSHFVAFSVKMKL